MVFTGLQNYITLLSDGVFWTSFQNNFLLVGASLLTQLPLGLIMALLLFSPVKGMRFFRSIYFMPFLMSTVAIGILFIYIYDGNFGLINQLLGQLGLDLGSTDGSVMKGPLSGQSLLQSAGSLLRST